ncbi:MAG TPA: hypothetical protein VFA26_25535, partial [Gemmataceae bacterium]|nr:hypothetical protein [Gemmataceae bacterium]
GTIGAVTVQRQIAPAVRAGSSGWYGDEAWPLLEGRAQKSLADVSAFRADGDGTVRGEAAGRMERRNP